MATKNVLRFLQCPVPTPALQHDLKMLIVKLPDFYSPSLRTLAKYSCLTLAIKTAVCELAG